MKMYVSRMLSRIIALVVIFAMMVCLLPVGRQEVAATSKLRNPRTTNDGTVNWDCVWFGHYSQSSDGKDGFSNEMIKWRVLSVDENEALLLADKNLDVKLYNETDTYVAWENATIRSWLNGYAGSFNKSKKDYTNDNFIDTAFTSAEQAGINLKHINNSHNYQPIGGNDTQDKVFLLDLSEATTSAYGFPNSYYTDAYATRGCINTDYVKAKGLYTNDSTKYIGNGNWWLRSSGVNSFNASYVRYSGYVDSEGSGVNLGSGYAVRPALWLNLKSDCWSFAGTVSSNGAVDERPPSSPKLKIGSNIEFTIPSEVPLIVSAQ